MAKNHIKRIAMPNTWVTKQKKGVTWVARMRPGMHSLEEGMPMILLFREMLGYANTAKEAKYILSNKHVLVDGKRRKDIRFNVGLMDVLSIPELKENYRISLNKFGKLFAIKINDKEAKEKICKISGKGIYKGKTQLRLSDGRVVLSEKGKYATGDSVLISIPEQKITKHLPLTKGAVVLLIKGKKIGLIGKIQEIKSLSDQDDIIVVKSGNETFETLKKYCFVVGENTPELKLE